MLSSAGMAQVTGLRIADYATMPMTGSTDFPSATANSAYLARVNFLAEEPREPGQPSARFFVNDLNGPLYILNKSTKQFSTYLNFNGRDSNPGLFNNFVFSSGFANGLITFQFDPDYGNNGKFYTVHMETPSSSGLVPDNTNFPGFNTAGYATTPSVDAPGSANRRTVLIQWTDTNINNDTFEGTARELLRMDMSGQIHPMGDLIFNPLAESGDLDWRVMYISIGDGGAGEGSGATRMTPQRLDTLGGKVLRIIPDLDQHTATSTVSPNGRYRIPNDNPFTSIADSRVHDELFAVGLRNPHRMSWDVDPDNPENNHLIVNDIGLHTWEEVNIIQPGRNFGYSQREGNQILLTNNSTAPLERDDAIPVQITDTVTAGTIVPTYPVAQYGHNSAFSEFIGDSISSGYVYRGSRMPELYGKYIFGEITTGQIFYCELDEMLAADDGNPSTMAEIHSLQILWDDPNDSPDEGPRFFGTAYTGGGGSAVHGPMFQIVERAYEVRGGQDPNLPGNAAVTGGSDGRADIRIQIDENGELYILSKSDGMIRAIVGTMIAMPGDYNLNGRVDAADYVLWRKTMGQQDLAPFSGADGSGNGMIDADDYDFWRENFAEPLSSGASASIEATVPEPAAALLVLCAAIWPSVVMRRFR
jgi:Glucose / Sorbosone dehydrogenase